MQIPRFFLTEPALDFTAGQSITISDAGQIEQIRRVLRMSPQDKIILLDGGGKTFHCTLQTIEARSATCRVDEVQSESFEPRVKVQLALALLKGDRFDWALQKATELGAHSITPILTTRTIVKINEQTDAKGAQAKLARWQTILREAAEQCERATIPHIVTPKKLIDFIDSATTPGTMPTLFICAERLQVATLKDILIEYTSATNSQNATSGTTIILLIGPEGGFTEDEIEYAQKRGAVPVSLGPRILRAETAALYAVAQTIWCLDK